MQKSSGDKESPWKIPLLMLMLSDIKVPFSYVRVICVFQFVILCFRKSTILGDFRFLFLHFSSIFLLIISWSLQPYEPLLHPFCSSRKRSFSSRCEYVLSVSYLSYLTSDWSIVFRVFCVIDFSK